MVLQLAIGAITIIYLDEMMTKYGITSGINLFIACGVSYAIVAGTFSILIPEAIAAINPAQGGGGAAAIPNAILAFGPLFFAVIVFLISIYVYDMKVELPLAFEQFRGIGGRLPIPFLYVSVLPVILASSLELSLTVWFRVLAHVTGTFGNIARFIAYYQPGAGGHAAAHRRHHLPDIALLPAAVRGQLRRDRKLRDLCQLPDQPRDQPVPPVGRDGDGARSGCTS